MRSVITTSESIFFNIIPRGVSQLLLVFNTLVLLPIYFVYSSVLIYQTFTKSISCMTGCFHTPDYTWVEGIRYCLMDVMHGLISPGNFAIEVQLWNCNLISINREYLVLGIWLASLNLLSFKKQLLIQVWFVYRSRTRVMKKGQNVWQFVQYFRTCLFVLLPTYEYNT